MLGMMKQPNAAKLNGDEGMVFGVCQDKDGKKASSGDSVTNGDGGTDGDDGDEDADKSSQVVQTWFTSKDHKNAYQSGHAWKKGQWTKSEITTLHCNIERYCQEHGITSAKKIIFEMPKDERKDFYRTISQGLNRPLFNIYRRVIRMYDAKNYIGKYSDEELQKLNNLRSQYGNDWTVIGNELGRSASSVKDRCRSVRDSCRRGHWNAEEERMLVQAVHEVQQQSGTDTDVTRVGGLSWASVAERVGTRTEKQCRAKWLNQLHWREKGGSEWTKTDDMLLIKKLNDLVAVGLKEEADINWELLCADWPSCRSAQWLRGKWWLMKHNIPGYNSLSLQALVESVDENLRTGRSAKRQASQLSVEQLSGNASVSQVAAALTVPIQIIPLHVAGGAVVGAGEVSFDEECHFVDDSGAILVSQPVSQGFVAFTAEGLATAGSFLLSSLGGAELKAVDISMLQAGGGLVVTSDSDKAESCVGDEHDIGEQVLLGDYQECESATVIVEDSSTIDVTDSVEHDDDTNYSLDPVLSEDSAFQPVMDSEHILN